MLLRNTWRLGRKTVQEFLDNGGPLLGAALAFWAILSVAPLMLVVLAITRWVLGDAASQGDLPAPLTGAVEPHAADWVESLVQNLQRSEAGPGAGLVGSLLLLWSASRLFRQMQDALNQLWRIRSDPSSVKESIVVMVKRAGAAAAMVFVLGGTLVLAIVLTSVAMAARGFIGGTLPGSDWAWSATTFGLSVAVLAGLFATIYRLLPDARIAWRDAAVGATATATVFCATEYPLSFYLGSQGIESAFGAAASLVTFLLWVYYCAQLFFLGAQFTAVWARDHGRGVRPNAGARVLGEVSEGSRTAPAYAADAFIMNAGAPDQPSKPGPAPRLAPYPATARASASSSSGSRL